MPTVYPWTFRQLGGDQKTLTLSGLNAPHGRARKGALVEDGIETRDSAVYYAGNDAPTMHLFGTKLDDFELHGRWSDQANGPGGAAALAETVKQWVKDQQVVQIDWGPLLSARGIFRKLIPSREDSGEIAWRLKIFVLQDLLAPRTRSRQAESSPKDVAAQVLAALNEIPKVPDVPGINGTFLDLLSDLISTVSTLTGAFVDIANQIDSFVQATFADLRRLQGAATQLSTAVITLKQTIASVNTQSQLLRDSGDSQVQWSSFATQLDVDSYVALALLSDTNRRCELAERGKQATSYTARAGDTWESISTAIFGGPSKADVLRQANGARYGQQPTPGATIHVPLDVTAT